MDNLSQEEISQDCSVILSHLEVYVVDDSVKFKEAAKHGNLIPLYRSIFSDHLTPVLAYHCLVKEDDRKAPSFLFESVELGLKVSNVASPLPWFIVLASLSSMYLRGEKPAGTAEEIEKQFGCESSRLIMVGDRPFTDIVYGNRNGFLTILTEPLRCAEEPLILQQRVGRTARAGQPGIVTSLYKESNCDHVTAIMDETSISCIDERHAHLMLDPSYESFRKHGSDLI
ncbi:Anthranilate synthase alpha subunit 1, chloroplastic [Capsicum chinense]|nr:Anthranilate synthase alpha subunit 1, chloroplastic [Capsicum chinense]